MGKVRSPIVTNTHISMTRFPLRQHSQQLHMSSAVIQTRSKTNWQRFQTAERHVLPPCKVVCRQPQIRQTVNNLLDSDLTLQASQQSSQAEVNPGAEGNMSIVLPADIETVG